MENRFFSLQKLLYLLIFIGVGSIFFWISWIHFHHTPQLKNNPIPIYGSLPPFSLIEAEGRQITQNDFLNKISVIDFIFTRCQGQCPFMSEKMKDLQKILPKDSRLQWVSISVDPEWDEPPVLQEYAKKYQNALSPWLFLTGKKEMIFSLMKEGFHLGVSEAGGTVEEPILHSNRFVLVDPQGQIRGYYPATDEDRFEQLKKDILTLLHRTHERQET
ncbi:MAG: SCO family protein [Chlamydiae bacterium]|nr:SCO family protein [Chlamydiota bacterium]MBI3277251.1 SCO family protein [Chlamydiota bacterium]